MAKKYAFLIPIVALVVAEILWGANKPVIKIGLETVPLVVFNGVTLMSAALLTLPLAIRGWKRISTKNFLILTLGSAMSVSLNSIFLLLALQMIPAANVALIGLFAPILLFILSAQFLKERLSLRTFIGILVAFAGGVVVIARPWEAAGGQEALIGSLFAILSVLGNVVGILICKPALKEGGAYQVTFLHLFAGALPLLLFALPSLGALRYEAAGANGYAAMTFDIIAITLANCLFMFGLKHRKAQEVGVFEYINPLTTIVVAWFLLSEALSIKTTLGAILIFLGVYITLKTKRRKSKA